MRADPVLAVERKFGLIGSQPRNARHVTGEKLT